MRVGEIMFFWAQNLGFWNRSSQYTIRNQSLSHHSSASRIQPFVRVECAVIVCKYIAGQWQDLDSTHCIVGIYIV